MTAHVLNLEPEGFSPLARARLERFARVSEGPLTRDELLRALQDVDVLIVRLGHHIDRDVLAAAPALRVISSATTGLDHIDLQAARERGIRVISLRGERAFLDSVRATVEHTWALMLTLLRVTHRAAAHAEAGGWDRDRFRGRELAGKHLGIVGLGRIGSAVARIAGAFQMGVSAYDPFVEAWPDSVGRTTSLRDLMALSDVMSIHVPLNDTTRDLIGVDELAALPAGAIVVNTSRGGVLDEDAVVRSLRSGHLGGAALDVQKVEEGGSVNEALLAWAREHPNLLLTPHIGGATYESMEKTEIFMTEKLEATLQTLEASERAANPEAEGGKGQ